MSFPQTIIQEALNIFRQEGVARLTEQELIAKLNISEASFREHFKDKEDVVRKVALFELESRKEDHQRLIAAESNPIIRLLSVVKLGLDDFKKSKAPVLQEMQQLYPQLWASYRSESITYNNHLVHDLLNDGILSGEIRRDVNLGLVVKIMMEQFSLIINPSIFPPNHYNTAEVFRSVFLYYIRGLCTQEGMKKADQFFSTL